MLSGARRYLNRIYSSGWSLSSMVSLRRLDLQRGVGNWIRIGGPAELGHVRLGAPRLGVPRPDTPGGETNDQKQQRVLAHGHAAPQTHASGGGNLPPRC